MSLIRALVVAALTSLIWLDASAAHAFCRTMTCNPKKSSDCTVNADGCVTTGEPLHWETSTLVYRFQQRASAQLVREEARGAVREAFHRWSDVTCPNGGRTSLRFVEGEDIAEDKPIDQVAASEAFGIYFRDLGWPHQGVDTTLALTQTLHSKRSGKITYADIEVNTTRHFAVDEAAPDDAVDLQAVITHEVGHYIGLAHSRVSQSIMTESYCDLGDDRCQKGRVAARRLSEDDIAAVCAIFPPGEPSAETARDLRTTEPSACSASAGRGAGSLGPGLGLLVIVGLVARRRLRLPAPR